MDQPCLNINILVPDALVRKLAELLRGRYINGRGGPENFEGAMAYTRIMPDWATCCAARPWAAKMLDPY